MSPKVKKIIAREWLIFLVVLLVSPLIVGTYTWRQASKFGFSEDLDHAFYYELSREEALAELRKIAQELHAAGLIPEVGEPEAKPGLGHPVPPMYKKRPLSVYLYNNVLVWCLNNGFTIINLLQDLLNFLGPYKRFSVLIV